MKGGIWGTARDQNKKTGQGVRARLGEQRREVGFLLLRGSDKKVTNKSKKNEEKWGQANWYGIRAGGVVQNQLPKKKQKKKEWENHQTL